MKVLKQKGDTIQYANSGTAISSGDVVVLGSRIGIALEDIAQGKSGGVTLVDVHELPAVTDTSFSQGDMLYWDASAKKLTKTAGSNALAGMCFENKATADATASVRLCDAVTIVVGE